MAAVKTTRMKVAGRVRVPGDKSISHRSLMLAVIADGRSRVRDILDAADVRSTASVLRALGARVPPISPDMIVDGVGRDGLRAPSVDLDCGNSGTTTRLMAGIVAACPFSSRFVGDASLSRRPMQRIAKPLSAMGARFEFERGDGLPMIVHGGELHAIDWNSETASAQVKSAVLLAAVVAGVPASVREPLRSRDHTERMLAARGVPVDVRGMEVRVAHAARVAAVDADVPADPSSAAFLAGLAALSDEGELSLEGVCVNPTRSGFFDVLREMGADVDRDDQRDAGGEPVATIRVSPGELRGVHVGHDRIPAFIDEVPLLACLAALAEGETVITGASELRVKESDRIAAVVSNLRAVGAEADELPDGLRIRGVPGARFRGEVRTHGDHRIAMAFGVLGTVPGNEIAVDDRSCVDVSYPRFWSDIQRVTST